MVSSRSCALCGALWLAGCGLVIDTDPADLVARRDAGAGVDAGRGIETDAGLVLCESLPTDAFPALDACLQTNDCAIVMHRRDCCGSVSAVGIHRDEVESFVDLEALCRDMYPPCACTAGPLCVERDGACGSTTVAVACTEEGRCESFLEP